MKIHRFKTVDSTNNFLKNLEEKEEFEVAIAKSQSSGRGRRGNNWSSEEGGAYFSFILKEKKDVAISEYVKLPLVVGYSLLRTFEEMEKDIKFQFKWTNDVYANDKKISGILVEKKREDFIIGIGINLNNEIKGEAIGKGISLKELTKKDYDIEKVIFQVIEDFKKNINYYLNGNWEEILNYLNSKNYLLDKNIIIDFREGNQKNGVAKEIAKSGEIIIEIDGKRETFSVGEIHIHK